MGGAFGFLVRSYMSKMAEIRQENTDLLKKKMPLMELFFLIYKRRERGPKWSTTRVPGNESKVQTGYGGLRRCLETRLVEDEGRMTNDASQAVARSPKFKGMRPGKEYKSSRKVLICEQIILT